MTAQRAHPTPIAEIFGPVTQGEGPLAGTATHFVRVAGCGYRCSWCDSPHAVLPELWSKSAERLTGEQIMDRLFDLPQGPRWVTLSGGNPAMYDLTWLQRLIHLAGWRTAVETQGDTWRSWLTFTDQLVLSPKPPSSGMATPKNTEAWRRFLDKCVRSGSTQTAVKIVCFDEDDYEWALAVRDEYDFRAWPVYLSVGTREPNEGFDMGVYRDQVCDGYRWLADKVAHDERAHDVIVLPQLHVLAYGERLGV